MKLLNCLFLLLILISCNQDKPTFINKGNEFWELIKVNDHDIDYRVAPFTGLYFFKNQKYDRFSLKKTIFDYLPSDNVIERDWYFDKKLYVSGFGTLRIVKLDQNNFVFYSARTKYEFKKSILPNGTRKVNNEIVIPIK